eukprot:m.324047 g.324047  ORF g.324047 m.324047 type:complete len:107 (+) comp20368_c0_seq1:16-336(+)
MQTYTVVVVLPCRPVLDTPTHMQHSTTPPAHRTQARRAGNGAIADMLAEAAHDRQLKPLRDALAPGGSAAVSTCTSDPRVVPAWVRTVAILTFLPVCILSRERSLV